MHEDAGRETRRNRIMMKRIKSFGHDVSAGFLRKNIVYMENCMVAVRVLFEGIHSGKRINFEALEYFKVENGKIVESWGYWPDKEIERQLLA